MKPFGDETGRGVFGKLPLRCPVLGVGQEVCIGDALAPSFDHQQSVGAEGVLGLIPLRLMIAHMAVLKRPVFRIGSAVPAELICPNKFIVGRRSKEASGEKQDTGETPVFFHLYHLLIQFSLFTQLAV